jgi:uncharacterized protein
MNHKRIILAGGSGFLGTALACELIRHGHEVVVFTRSPQTRTDGVREVAWDGKNLGGWVQLLEGAQAIVNLTGKNINCPHTPENLQEITASRVNSVSVLNTALGQVKTPPRVWVQASATGFYGDSKDRLCEETSPNGDDALSRICRDWENAFAGVNLPQTRKVTLRIGFVLGRESGALPVLARLTKWFLGGAVGSGRQYISWIHLADLVQMFVAAIERDNLSGTFNAVAPNPVTNAEFMRELRRALHRPWSPPAPEIAVRLGARLMDSEPSLALVSQRCAPKRFLEADFKFQFFGLRAALENLCGG